MTPQITIDLKGNFNTHPFAELLVEISQAKLSGSLRLMRGEKKTIVYIRDGEVVYGVSNSRSFRLFNVLLSAGKIDNQTLARHPAAANDLEFAASLVLNGQITQEDVDLAVVEQIKQIMIDTLVWADADWVFSPLARLREDLVYDADIYNVLIEYARCISPDMIMQRFRSVNEAFAAPPGRAPDIHLQKHEADLLSMFAGRQMTIDELKPLCQMPEAALFQGLYALWLGGFLYRQNWNAAFSQAKLNHIRSTKLSLIKEPSKTVKDETPDTSVAAVEEPPMKLPVIEIPLSEYMRRVEEAETHYDIMGVSRLASAADIKAAYLGLAKAFHPDRYYRETGDILRRIQVAFTNLAHAYETLKSPESRENYDFKMRKQLDMREKRRAEGMPETSEHEQLNTESGLESFEQGLNYLIEEEYGHAATQLARAVHASPQNALYHAYYGQALSFLEKFQHKAESEMQTAARLDPKNAKIRLMLAQFFIDINMVKRAEGELNRFLEVAPDNKEAKDLLNSLRV